MAFIIDCLRGAINAFLFRIPLRKAISSQLALSSFELLNLKTPLFEGRRYE
jgi:hypothetical protein